MNQTAEDAVVLNYDDPLLREFGESRIEETASKPDEKLEKTGNDLVDEEAGETKESAGTEADTEETEETAESSLPRASGEGLLVFQQRAFKRGFFPGMGTILSMQMGKKNRSL